MVFPSLKISKVSGRTCPEILSAPPTVGLRKFLPIFHSAKFGQSAMTAAKRQEMQGFQQELVANEICWLFDMNSPLAFLGKLPQFE